MRRWQGFMVLLLAFVAFVAVGCGMPRGVKDSLYTAQIISAKTAAEAGGAEVWPYRPSDPNETDQVRADRLAKAVVIMTDTLQQVDKNLEQVVGWARGTKEGLPDDGS